MRCLELPKDDSRYPGALATYLAERAPEVLQYAGQLEILEGPSLAWLSSIRCPGSVIAATYAYAQKVRVEGITVIGGFHSPMEWECLRIFIASDRPVVICPARSLERMRLPGELQRAFAEQRLLFLSPFRGNLHRATAEQAAERNEFVAALASEIFIAYASPGGKMEALADTLEQWKKPIRRIRETPP